MTKGKCDDCGRVVEFGEWPFDCDGRGHGNLIRMAILGKGRTPDYAPPTPISPFKEAQVTRDWMNPDGSMTPMKPGEWNGAYVGKEA